MRFLFVVGVVGGDFAGVLIMTAVAWATLREDGASQVAVTGLAFGFVFVPLLCAGIGAAISLVAAEVWSGLK